MTAVSQALERARSLRAEGRLADALEALTGTGEFHADLCAARGAIEFALGRYSDAALSLSVVAVTRPEDTRAYFNLALCLERAQRWDAAAGTFERVLQLDGGRSDARLALGACLLKMNHPQEALAHFEQVRGSYRQALFGKAVALQLLGRFREAARAYEELITVDPESGSPESGSPESGSPEPGSPEPGSPESRSLDCGEALANWIALSVETGDPERVRDLSQRLLALAPRSKVALQGLAAAALEQGDYDAAVTNCGRLLDLAPECLEAWHNLRIAMEQARFGPAEPSFAVHHGGTL